MNPLPASIESALEDSGFSQTEIVILRRLMDEEGLGLRELAAKTGKSTGVFDQATKKLMSKGILIKREVNGFPKYVLHSMEAISHWMEEDLRLKRDMLTRKFQNFESFLQTLKVDKKHPEMKFFEGIEGLGQAYRSLAQKDQEIRAYIPVFSFPDDDPLREFFIEHFRDRRRKKAFLRVIAPDTPFGRRYQSRDAYEYRKTILVPADDFPLAFEKYIYGDTIACINRSEKKGSFIHFPELAESERAVFDKQWVELENPRIKPAVLDAEGVAPGAVPVPTRTLSALREFFLAPKSIVTFGVFALVAAGITFGLFKHTERLNLERVKDKVQSIAATAAFQFEAKDLEVLQVEADWKKPEWAKVVNQLRQVRESNAGVMYAYIIRHSKGEPSKLEFVADSHSLNPYVNFDDDPTNDINFGNDGPLDPLGKDLLQWPGQIYEDAPSEAFEAFTGVTSNEDFYFDQWGKLISGYAPIYDATGRAIAAVAVDVEATTFKDLNSNSFSFIPYFLLAFLIFVGIRLIAFNTSLFKELWELLQLRKVVFGIFCCAIFGLILVYGLYLHTLLLVKQEVGERLMSIAATASPTFNPADLRNLKTAEDMKTEEYQKVFRQLNEVRANNKDIKWAYIQRATDSPNTVEFVADADSNFNLPTWVDYNNDGKPQPEEENVAPGVIYQDFNLEIWREALVRPTAEPDFYLSQWGTYLSGYAPIKESSGKTVAVLGVDMNMSDILNIVHKKFSLWFWFLGIFLVSLALYVIAFREKFHARKVVGVNLKKDSDFSFKEICEYMHRNKLTHALLALSLAGSFFTLGLYFYTVHVRTQEIGEKLVALAAIAAQQVNPDDLDKLRIKEDMRKDEYQKLYFLLNGIRSKSTDVKWAYILRPTGKAENEWEFVVDADTNYNLPHLWSDLNYDGKLDSADENVWPGFAYDISKSTATKKVMSTKKPQYGYAYDQWGSFISGEAPIIKNEKAVAILGLDMDLNSFIHDIRFFYFPWLFLFGILGIASLLLLRKEQHKKQTR